MEAKLIIRKGPRTGDTFRVAEGAKIIMGRSVHSDCQLLDEGLSRTHAMVENHGTYCEVSDLQSSNGTFLNGKKIKTAILRHGDIVKMGDAILEFAMGESAPQGQSTIRILDEHDSRMLDSGGIKRKYEVNNAESILGLGEDEDDEHRAGAAQTLAALYQITNAINGQTEREPLYDTIMDAIMKQVPADRGFLVLKENDQLIPKVSRSREPEHTEMVLSYSVLNEAVENGNSVLTADAAEDERFNAGQSILLHNIRSVMCVPLNTFSQKIIGALYLDTVTSAAAFTESDLQFLSAVGYQAGTAIERQQLTDQMEDLLFSIVRSLVAAVEAKDEYTSGHSERVTAYSVLLARELGFEDEDMDNVKLAGLLHDVGKIGIPEHILNSSSALSEEEWEIMKSHPDLAERILSKIRNDRIMIALDAAKYHHEKMDGSGYPEGMKGEDIPMIARIVAVADAFDAMTSNRRYRTNFDDDRVVNEFKRCSGSHFDQDVIKAFLSLHSRGEMMPLLSIGDDIYSSFTRS